MGWMIFVMLMGMSLIQGCSLPNQKVDENVFYKRDMQINVNGYKGDGVLVVPKSGSYDFDIVAKGKADLFTLQTCHREISMEKAGNNGFFGNDKEVKINGFVRVDGLETEGACPMELGAFELKAGRHSWGFIDFGGDESLPALIKCNGSVFNMLGVSACQSHEGLIEEIEFPVKVGAHFTSDCPLNSSDGQAFDGLHFKYKINKGRCVYAFNELDPPHRLHRLTTLGYQQILLREQ